MRQALAACAAHHTRHLPGLAPVVCSDAAFLLAHATDTAVEHALDGSLPAVLDRVDMMPADERDELFVAAKRSMSPGLALTAGTDAPAPCIGLAAARGSWLLDGQLRETLGAAVFTALRETEDLYTDHPAFRPGAVPLPEALSGVGEAICSNGSLDAQWALFVEVHTAHALARANELPFGAGPLDDRIPAYVTHLATLEPITQADTLSNAVHFFRYSKPAEQFARTTTRYRAARTRTTAQADFSGPVAAMPSRPDRSASHPNRRQP